MADEIVKNIKIRYTQEGLQTITRTVQSYNKATREMTTYIERDAGKGFTTMSKNIKSMDASMGGLGSTANSLMMRFIGLNAIINYGQQAFRELQKFIGEGIEAFREFEKSMAEVSSILDSTTRNTLPSLEVGLTNLSVKYGQAIGDLTKGLYEIISAAFTVDEAMSLLNVVTKASIAGLTSVTSAVKTFTGVLNAYGLSAAHAAELSDVMFEAVVRGNFTFGDLESALGYVTPIAASAGVGFKEVASALATATRQGQHLDSVTRGLGLMIQNIIDPTTEAAEAARKYGIDMSLTALQTKGLEGFLKDLAQATETYGTQILPEMIGNMRSLRVALALTSKTGIQGFTEDMDLMNTATGRTDAAMATMMNTQQMMVDILAQEMDKLKRSVGEAWSSFDIWWQQTKLWWGTLFSGGDADKTVRDFTDAVIEIKRKYLENIVSPATKGGLTVFEKLKQGYSVTEAIETGALTKYLGITQDIENLNDETTALTNARVALDGLAATSKKTPSIRQGGGGEDVTFTDTFFLDEFNKQMVKLGRDTLPTTISIKEFNDVVREINGGIAKSTQLLEDLVNAESEARTDVDEIKAAFEDMAAAIVASQSQIVSLESEINGLKDSISSLSAELEIMSLEKPFEIFQHYATLGAKYGGEFIGEWTNTFDQFGNNMNDVLTVIYEYNDAMEETEKAQKAAEKASNDLRIAMAYNNLQILKLQLIGMVRRRGNTRSEMKAMKQLEIENTKLRIEEMQKQYDADVASNEKELNADEAAYDEAQSILQRYIDSEEHAIWQIKQTRDTDMQDLEETINEQQDLLNKRTGMLQTEFGKLNEMQSLYQSSLLEIAKDETLAEAYKELTGFNALTQAKLAYQDYLNFIAKNPIPGGVGSTVSAVATSTSMAQSPEAVMAAIDFRRNKFLRGYATGTDYVPQTGAYILHKGEAVVPAGQNGGGITIGNISVTVPVKTDANPKEIAAAVAEAIGSKILMYDSSGNLITKYRRR